MYYTYMLRCEDDSIYTGMTTDIKRRMEEHFSRAEKNVQNIQKDVNLKN